MREIYWRGHGPFNGLIKGEASHTMHLLYCCRSFRGSGGLARGGHTWPPNDFLSLYHKQERLTCPSTLYALPSTNKQTLGVISRRVQKCTESKRGSHACIDTQRDRQTDTRWLLLLLLTGTNEIQGKVTGKLKSHLTGAAILISNSLDSFFVFPFRLSIDISSHYTKRRDFASGLLPVSAQSVSQALASLAVSSYMTGSCLASGEGVLTFCTVHAASGRWEKRDLWVHRSLTERLLVPPPGRGWG